MFNQKIRIILGLMAVLLVGSSCNKSKLDAPETLTEASQVEAEAMAEKLGVAIETCNIRDLRKLFDMDAAVRRGLLGGGISSRSQKVLHSSLRQQPNLLKNVFCLGTNQNVTLLRVRPLRGNGRRSALFRIEYGEDGGINYLEFPIGRSKQGKVLSDDVFMYTEGWMFSDRINSTVKVGLADVHNTQKYADVLALFESDPVAGLKAAELLAPGFRNSKVVLINAVAAASQISAEAYTKELARLSELFPDDPALDLIEIDGFLILENFAALHVTVDRLDKAVGGDPYLDRFRVVALLGSEQFSKATAVVQKRIDAAPEDEVRYIEMLDVQLVSKNYAGALEVMKEIGNRFSTTFNEELVAEDTYPEFAKTPEWKQYLAWLDENFEFTETE